MDDADNHLEIILVVWFRTVFVVVFYQVSWQPSDKGSLDLKVII